MRKHQRNVQGMAENENKSRCTIKNEKKERMKNSNTIASRMKQVVERLMQGQKNKENGPVLTVFVYKSQQNEIISSFLHKMRKENPNLFEDRTQFLELLTSKYDSMLSTINESYSCDGSKVSSTGDVAKLNKKRKQTHP